MCLTEDKLGRLRNTLLTFEGRKKVIRKDLERLGGLLAHCAKVVQGGHTFSRRVYNLMHSVKYYYKMQLSVGFQEDVLWWLDYAERLNGKAQILGHLFLLCSQFIVMPVNEGMVLCTTQIG